MSKFPDLKAYGYEILQKIGSKCGNGTIAWKANEIKSGQLVVLKQFCFAATNSISSWKNDYSLDIKFIPRVYSSAIANYLGFFTTKNCYFLIKEYKESLGLARYNQFKTEDITLIITKIIDIVVYLQNKISKINYLNWKKENLLIDKYLNIYLLNYGLAKIESINFSYCGIVKVSPGLINPEKLNQPIELSDRLYEYWLLLNAHSPLESYSITVKVKTNKIKNRNIKIPYGSLMRIWSFSVAGGIAVGLVGMILGIGAAILTVIWGGTGVLVGLAVGAEDGAMAGFLLTGGALLMTGAMTGLLALTGAWGAAGVLSGSGIGSVSGDTLKQLKTKGFGQRFAVVLFAIGFGISSGVGLFFGVVNPSIPNSHKIEQQEQ